MKSEELILTAFILTINTIIMVYKGLDFDKVAKVESILIMTPSSPTCPSRRS